MTTFDRSTTNTGYSGASTGRSTVVGVFEDRRRAEEAVAELERIGFDHDQIGFVARDGDGHTTHGHREGEVTTDTGPGSGALTGAATGGVLGGIIGAAAALAIPGVGPAVAAGFLGPILGSAAAGAAVGATGGGLMGGLVTTGVSEEDARYYDSEFRAGRTLVTVKAGDRYDEAQRILRQYGAYDVESRGSSMGSTGHMGTQSFAGATGTAHVADQGVVRVPEIEERLNVEKREAQMGEVRVHKTVETEQQTVPVELHREEVHVERRDVEARPLAEGEVAAFEEGTIRVPIRGEEAIVHKEAVVTGEVVINKERTIEREEITDTVRRQHVEVDENYHRERDNFRQHFDTLNANRAGSAGYGWDQAEPNYRSGWAAGRDTRYANRNFEDVETDIRSNMYRDHADDRWQQLREEVREGFQRARSY